MTILAFLIVFMGIVLVHELGHFSFAKLFDVRVLEFAIGFGPAIYSKKGRETTFRINAFPFGGYVRLSGEDPTDFREEDEGRRFYDKPAWQRLLIALAGPVFSILAGYVIFFLVVNVWGVRFVGVDRVLPDTPAQEAGLRPGDLIVKINGEYVFDNVAISRKIREGKDITMTVLRDGNVLDLYMKPELVPREIDLRLSTFSGTPVGEFVSIAGLKDPTLEDLKKLKGEFVTVMFTDGEVSGILDSFGYVPERYAVGFVFSGLSNVFRKDVSIFKKGDVLLKVDGLKIDGWLDLIRAFTYVSMKRDSIYMEILGRDLEWWTIGADDVVRVVYEREGEILDSQVERSELLAILSDSSSLEPQVKPYKPRSFKERIEISIARGNWILAMTWSFLSRFSFIRGVAEGEVAGPVGIAGVVGEAVKLGLDTVLTLVAVITINLGLFNLLPLPALDGGRIVFALFEIVTGKKLDPKIEGMIHTIGFIVLMAFLIYVTFFDIGRLFR